MEWSFGTPDFQTTPVSFLTYEWHLEHEMILNCFEPVSSRKGNLSKSAFSDIELSHEECSSFATAMDCGGRALASLLFGPSL